jgi:hypothetical protein
MGKPKYLVFMNPDYSFFALKFNPKTLSYFHFPSPFPSPILSLYHNHQHHTTPHHTQKIHTHNTKKATVHEVV